MCQRKAVVVVVLYIYYKLDAESRKLPALGSRRGPGL